MKCLLLLLVLIVLDPMEAAPGGSLVVGGVYKPRLAGVKLDYINQALAAGRLAWEEQARYEEKQQKRRVSSAQEEVYVPAFFTSAENRQALLQAKSEEKHVRPY